MTSPPDRAPYPGEILVIIQGQHDYFPSRYAPSDLVPARLSQNRPADVRATVAAQPAERNPAPTQEMRRSC